MLLRLAVKWQKEFLDWKGQRASRCSRLTSECSGKGARYHAERIKQGNDVRREVKWLDAFCTINTQLLHHYKRANDRLLGRPTLCRKALSIAAVLPAIMHEDHAEAARRLYTAGDSIKRPFWFFFEEISQLEYLPLLILQGGGWQIRNLTSITQPHSLWAALVSKCSKIYEIYISPVRFRWLPYVIIKFG